MNSGSQEQDFMHRYQKRPWNREVFVELGNCKMFHGKGEELNRKLDVDGQKLLQV